MRLRLEGGLLYAEAALVHRGVRLALANVIVDTGSAGTLLSVDALLEIGLIPEPEDKIRRIRGVGGSEFVFVKAIDRLEVGELAAADLTIEIGALDYGFPADGILGLDFLTKSRAVLNLATLDLYPAVRPGN